ncbi:SAV_2336 N-terminal domain-related protein [Streptomyces sp. NPDC002092]
MPGEHSDRLVGELVDRLRGALGVEPSARELAESLWLAGHLGGVLPEGREAARQETPAPPREPREKQSPLRPQPDAPAPRGGLHDRARLHPPRPEPSVPAPAQAAATPVRVPVATTLPDPLHLQRALRPLQRYRPPVRPPAHHLDEQATAERAAETGLLLPVLHVEARREARLRLLMDASTSTVVWQSTLEELRQICAGIGAFREVSVHYVHQGADGRLLAGTAPDPEAGLRRPAEQLRDPTGRQLTLVLSDCAGPLWRSGRMQRLLHHWGRVAPVAVVQPLPRRMWHRTHLPALPGVLRRREGLGARLEFSARAGDVPEQALPVPVLAPARFALGTWARLLSADTGLSLPAAAAWVRADHPAARSRPRANEADADTLVHTFRRTASRQAVSLAVWFSAVPLTLPVMQLVQRVMLPRSGPAVLAEVLLGGLVRRGAEDGWYDFAPGVREALLRLLSRGDAQLLLKHCGDYVERNFGRRARNFPALALAQLTGDDRTAGGGEAVPGAFAEVSALVVGRYLGHKTQRRTFDVVFQAEDQEWATWVAGVLGAHGQEVNLRSWDRGEQLENGLRRALREYGRHAVLLYGDRCGPHETRLAEAAAHQQVLALDVRSGGVTPPPWVGASLSWLPQKVALWLLLQLLGVGRSAGLPDWPAAAFPGASRLVVGEMPEADPGNPSPEGLLARLRAELGSRPGTASCVLVGPPASGKSQAAAEYVRRHGDEYDFVWWVRGDSRAERREDIRQCAFALGLPPSHMADLDGVLWELGRANVRWLIVHDGWNDLGRPDELPLRGGQVLVTTRDEAGAAAVRAVLVRVGGEAEPPVTEADREALVRGGVARLNVSRSVGGVVSYTGFFVAPCWLVTTRAVNASVREIVTMDGRTYQAGRIHEAGDLALVHVPEAVGPDCLWLSDVTHVGPRAPGTLYATTGMANAVYLRPLAVTFTRALGRDTLWVADEPPIPLDATGGPVLDPVDGAVVAVMTDPAPGGGGKAVRVGQLKQALCESGEAELWHSVVQAHDRYHAECFRARGSDRTWTGVQSTAITFFDQLLPADRTELYGLLAELPPPDRPETVYELLGERRADRYPPYSWRDGVGLLHRGDSQTLALTYAARVWAELGVSGEESADSAREKLREWVTQAASARNESTRRAVAQILGSTHEVTPFADNLLLVDIGPRLLDIDRYVWRLTQVRGDERTTIAEFGATSLPDLRRALGPQVTEALRACDTPESRANVIFSLPVSLVWNPPWEEHAMAERVGPRSVVVRNRDRTGRPMPVRQRRWAALSEGPLVAIRVPPQSIMTRMLLEESPAAAVLVGCAHEFPVLHEAERCSIPLVLWNRAPDHADCAEFRDRAAEVVRSSRTPAELFERIAHLRSLDIVWARHLAIHYDPPDLP